MKALVVLVVAAASYFLPAIVAHRRGHPNAMAISVENSASQGIGDRVAFFQQNQWACFCRKVIYK